VRIKSLRNACEENAAAFSLVIRLDCDIRDNNRISIADRIKIAVSRSKRFAREETDSCEAVALWRTRWKRSRWDKRPRSPLYFLMDRTGRSARSQLNLDQDTQDEEEVRWVSFAGDYGECPSFHQVKHSTRQAWVTVGETAAASSNRWIAAAILILPCRAPLLFRHCGVERYRTSGMPKFSR